MAVSFEPHVTPLERRIPNPPAAFVGRRRAFKWLLAALARAPVTVLWGLGGIGKSALATAALAKHLTSVGRRPSVAVYFDPMVRIDPARAAFRALASSSVLAGEDELDALVIDTAEKSCAVVLLEDAHHADAARFARFLSAIARYARRSRWLVTSRRRIEGVDLAGQMLALDPMPTDELARLARTLDPARARSDAALDDAARRALGSPWRLRFLLGTATEQRSILEPLAPDVRELAKALALLGRPLDRSALPEHVLAAVESLAAFQLVEHDPHVVRLHEMTRAILLEEAGSPDDARVELAIDLLSCQPDPSARMGAIRLAQIHGRARRAVELAARHRDALVADGYGAALWEALRDHLDEATRLALAIDVGKEREAGPSPPAVPGALDPSLALAWAKVLYARGDLTDARVFAADARARASGDVAEEALLVEASAAVMLDDKGTRDILTSATLTNRSFEARRLAALALLQWGGGDWTEASAGLQKVRDFAGTVDARAEQTIAMVAFRLLRDWGDHDAAISALRRPYAGDSARALHTFVGRAGLALEMWCAVERARFDEARALRDRLAPLSSQSSPTAEVLSFARAALMLAEGQYEELRTLLARREREGVLSPNLGPRWVGLDAELGARTGRRATAWPLLQGEPYTVSTVEFAFRAEAERALRWREAPPACSLELPAPELAIMRARNDALVALRDGAPREALRHALSALDCARASSFTLLELDARALVCDLALVAAERDAWPREVRAMRARADALVVPRARAEVEFHEAILARRPLQEFLPLLRDRRAPSTVRRAHAIMGDSTPLDLVDDAVVARARDELAFRVRHPAAERGARVRSSEGVAGWIDFDTHALVMRDGVVVPFGEATVIWKLLAELAQAPDGLDRESLCQRVWGYPSYHPSRHDNPIKLGVRNLRRKLEEGGAASLVITATAGGYALRTDVGLIERT